MGASGPVQAILHAWGPTRRLCPALLGPPPSAFGVRQEASAVGALHAVVRRSPGPLDGAACLPRGSQEGTVQCSWTHMSALPTEEEGQRPAASAESCAPGAAGR